MPFTFKTNRQTGPYRSFFKPSHYIKWKKEMIGTIDDDDFTIRLKVHKTVEDLRKGPNCDFKWIKLTARPASLQDAKEFLNKHCDEILQKFDIYFEHYLRGK